MKSRADLKQQTVGGPVKMMPRRVESWSDCSGIGVMRDNPMWSFSCEGMVMKGKDFKFGILWINQIRRRDIDCLPRDRQINAFHWVS